MVQYLRNKCYLPSRRVFIAYIYPSLAAGIVVRKEKPELEEQKDNLVLNIAAGKKKLQELEDEILRWGGGGGWLQSFIP